MKDATISELYDLTQTIATKIFEGKTYPWEVLPLIKDFILKLGETLDPAEYEKRGENEYELVGVPLDHDYNEPDCDVEWIKKNYATVTPVLCDKTAYAAITDIKTKLFNGLAYDEKIYPTCDCAVSGKKEAKL